MSFLFLYLLPFIELPSHPLLLLLPQLMCLQLEILLHPAARWGEDVSLLVAAVVAAALLLQDCLRGVETPGPGSSGIMVLGRQWLPLPLPPPCYTPPPPLLPPRRAA